MDLHTFINPDESNRAIKKLAEAVDEDRRPHLTADEWLAALRHLDGVSVEFAPRDQLQHATMVHGEGGYVVDNVAVLSDDWDGSALDRYEAGALLEQGTLIEPVPREETAL